MFEVFYMPTDHHGSVYCAHKHAAMKSAVFVVLGCMSWVEQCCDFLYSLWELCGLYC